MQALRILHVSSELSPYAKTGGLADVVAGLPAELANAGHDVRILIPDYAAIKNKPELSPVRNSTFQLNIGGNDIKLSFNQLDKPQGKSKVYFLNCPAMYDTPEIYSSGALELQRYLTLCLSVPDLLNAADWQPDVIHCHDWHAAAIPKLIKAAAVRARTAPIPTLLSIHNIGYQGVFAPTDISAIDRAALNIGAENDINLLAMGIESADWLSTVSPTHAKEIRTPEYGMGLEDSLAERSDRLTGILNGADYSSWTPEHDPLIPANFGPMDIGGKAICKSALTAEFGLDPDRDKPLVGCVSRLAPQKGIDIILDVLPALLGDRAINCVILGDGDPELLAKLELLASQFPAQLAFIAGYDEALAHRIHAASDMFLVPSRYEPCGLTQIYSMKYGTIPVVRQTGGLADTVEHFDPAHGTGNGSVFLDADAGGLRWALGETLHWYGDKSKWGKIVSNAMAADFSWQQQAPKYVEIYRELQN